MAGTQLRTMGTTATFAPVIKRGVATLTDGRTVSLIIDTNLAASAGTDVTGVAKIHLYVSNDVSRTTFTLAASLTPAVAPASSTRAARASLALGSDNSVWVAWQGVDNGLYISQWTYSAGVLTFVATTTIQAAGAVTDRFRAVDIDVAGTNSVAVATYEANVSTGNAAFHRVYVRSVAATWVRAVNATALITNQFIRTNSEDICVAWRGDGIVSNVGRFLLYGTKTHTAADLGDLVQEYSYNVSTAPADGGVVLGAWGGGTYNVNQAAGTRRAMLFTLSSSLYMFAGVIGAAVPKFIAIKLTSGNYGNPTTVNTAGYISTTALANYFQIDTSANPRTYWSASYKDNRLLFGFAGLGTGLASRIMREVSMSWDAVGSVNSKPTIDLVPRPTDSAFYGNGGPIGIYGGDNKRTQAGLKYYNWVAMYGQPNNTLSTTLTRPLRFVSEDTFDAPAIVAPVAIEPTNRPIYRVRVENTNLQPNLYGKLEIAIASNSLFTTSVKSIVEPDANLRYFGSKDGLSGGVTQVAIATPGPTQALTQGTWYWRARIVSDKDTPGAWSDTQSFSVSHPPTANPVFPTPTSVLADVASNQYSFAWTRSDTEPTDTQTAFRVVVRRLDTLANVLDTGFVASGVTSTTQTIDGNALGIIEIPLDWTVQLKDADGVAGPISTPVQWVIGDPPNLTVISPTFGVPVSTALPTVNWTFTGFGQRSQRSFRVSIFDNTTPNLLTNGSFELGTLANWGAFDGTAAVSSVQTNSGSFSAFITPSGSGPAPKVEASTLNDIAVVPGMNYTAEVSIRATTANKQLLCGINWYDASSVYISTSQVNVNPTAGAFVRVTCPGIAPVGAAKGHAFGGLTGTPAVGDTCYVDDFSFHLTGTSTSDPIVTTGWLVGTTNTYTFRSQVLVNNAPYRVVLDVQDTGGLITTNEVAITTSWSAPALASSPVATAFDDYKVRLTWTNAAQDSSFISYRVYRRYMKTSITAFDLDNTATTWFLLYETSDQLTNYTFDDYLAPLNRSVEYVIVQLADRFGSLIESNITATQTVTLVGSRYFFVPEVPFGGIASFEAAGVTGDNFAREVEQETLQVIGRGRQVQVGDDLGYSGTLTIELRNASTARRDREFFEIISSTYNKVYVKTPFGDVFLIALGNVSTTRQAGYGGYADISDLSVPYMQIIDEDLVARSQG